MKNRWLSMRALASGLLALALATTASGEAGESGTPAAPKVLTIAGVETPQGFDKDFQQQVASTEAQANVGATLIRYGVRTDAKGVQLEDYGKLLPGLAESWTISRDNLAHTFKLRKGVKSHYGNDLTADDVKWTYDRSFTLKGLGVTSFGLEPFLDASGSRPCTARSRARCWRSIPSPMGLDRSRACALPSNPRSTRREPPEPAGTRDSAA